MVQEGRRARRSERPVQARVGVRGRMGRGAVRRGGREMVQAGRRARRPGLTAQPRLLVRARRRRGAVRRGGRQVVQEGRRPGRLSGSGRAGSHLRLRRRGRERPEGSQEVVWAPRIEGRLQRRRQPRLSGIHGGLRTVVRRGAQAVREGLRHGPLHFQGLSGIDVHRRAGRGGLQGEGAGAPFGRLGR